MYNESPIIRRPSTRIYVGNVPIGDGAPIAVQSMTNTRTTDVEATVAQIRALENVGADIVRVSVPTMDAAEDISSQSEFLENIGKIESSEDVFRTITPLKPFGPEGVVLFPFFRIA